MRKVVIEKDIVINVVEAGEDWQPPAGCQARAHDTADIGWIYANGVLKPPIAEKTAEKPLDWRALRQQAYAEKEAKGDLPASLQENIDELWKALETAELHGAELPPAASSIIRHRRAVKTKYPKDESDLV